MRKNYHKRTVPKCQYEQEKTRSVNWRLKSRTLKWGQYQSIIWKANPQNWHLCNSSLISREWSYHWVNLNCLLVVIHALFSPVVAPTTLNGIASDLISVPNNNKILHNRICIIFRWVSWQVKATKEFHLLGWISRYSRNIKYPYQSQHKIQIFFIVFVYVCINIFSKIH